MNQAALAWAALMNVMRASARDPLGAFVAGYSIQLWPILQGVHQLRARYGQKAGIFLSNAGMLQVFGVNDHDGARLVSDLLGQGRPFFVDIARDGIVLYEAPGYPLASPKTLPPDEARAEARRHFDQWIPSAERFLKLATVATGDGFRNEARSYCTRPPNGSIIASCSCWRSTAHCAERTRDAAAFQQLRGDRLGIVLSIRSGAIDADLLQ